MQIMKYMSDSAPLEAPKEPDGSIVFELYKLVASPSRRRRRWRASCARAATAGATPSRRCSRRSTPSSRRCASATLALRADEARLDAVLAEAPTRARDRRTHDAARAQRRRHSVTVASSVSGADPRAVLGSPWLGAWALRSARTTRGAR